MGPNLKKLVSHKMAMDAISSSTQDGLKAAITFLLNKQRIVEGAKKATEWVKQAIELVKTAPDNPYGDDDEAIAGEVLRRIARKRKQAPSIPPA